MKITTAFLRTSAPHAPMANIRAPTIRYASSAGAATSARRICPACPARGPAPPPPGGRTAGHLRAGTPPAPAKPAARPESAAPAPALLLHPAVDARAHLAAADDNGRDDRDEQQHGDHLEEQREDLRPRRDAEHVAPEL